MKGMVSKSRFEGIKLICPPIRLQQRFASRFILVEKLRSINDNSFEDLDTLFVSLQHRAFRGEL